MKSMIFVGLLKRFKNAVSGVAMMEYSLGLALFVLAMIVALGDLAVPLRVYLYCLSGIDAPICQ